MKNLICLLFVVLLFASCQQDKYEEYKTMTNTKSDYLIIPEPANLKMSDGKFLVDENTTIFASDSLQNEAILLREMIKTVSEPELEIANTEKEEGRGIYLKLDENIENDEGYTIDASYDKIIISGKTPAGVFYGIQTLRQLLPASSEAAEKLTVPAVAINDAPEYTYRGMHLDVGRHFFPVEFIKKYIDLIAMHKMNTFHWHLTEDQGWRIEIKKYPKLTEIGSIRKETMVDKNFDPYVGDGVEYGGFYTQDEIREVVSYAKDRHVRVIPEIEMPGHASAALAAYPELGNNTGPYEVATTWGVFEEIYAPKEETFKFLEDVLTEVMALFPSEYIHIGGDEAPKTEWENSAQAQAVIKREGLKDEHELQSYFIQRIEKFLNAHGRKIIGWDEILQGGLAPNATVMSWRGEDGGIAAAKQGHDVIMTPNSYLYFDYYQADPEEEPLAIGGMNTLKEVYSYNPTPEKLSKKEAEHILGAQGNLWTEYIASPEYVEYMVLPRMAALAEVVWSPSEKNWEGFKNRLRALSKHYDAMGVNYATHFLEDESGNASKQLKDSSKNEK